VTEQELAIDAVRRLNRADVKYLLTGAMVSNYWGIPRTTHDLDFVAQLADDSIPRLFSEFAADFYVDESAARAVFSPPYQRHRPAVGPENRFLVIAFRAAIRNIHVPAQSRDRRLCKT